MRNGYWLAHRLLQSRSRGYYGDIYNIPDEVGPFDVVLFGMVLPHLGGPFYALAQNARLSKGRGHHHPAGSRIAGPLAYFIPNAQMNPNNLESHGACWVFTEECFREMLQVLGFKIESVTYKKHLCTGRNPAAPEECMTMIARRVQ